jgi:hypothetical protein
MIRLPVHKSVLWITAALVVYQIILEIYYINFISIYYERYGFFLEVNINKYIEAKVILFLTLIISFFISRKSEFIYSVFTFFVILFLIPGLTTFSLNDQDRGPLYSIVFLVLSVGIFSSLRIKLFTIGTSELPKGLVFFIIGCLLLPIVLNFGIYLNLKNLFLEEVYETRDLFSGNSSTFLDYLYNWLVKAVVPVCMVYFYVNKKYFYTIILLLIFIYLYMLSGNKIVYITSFLMLFFLFVGDDYFEKVKYFIAALILGLLVIPLIDQYVLNSHSFKGIFVMRTLMLPAQLNYFYFDFFHNAPLFYAESHFFSNFNIYPFDRPVGFVIAEKYFDTTEMNANNGIIGDGYMNLGYPGIAINIFMVTIIFLFFNSCRIDPRYLGIFLLIIFLLLSAPMLSMFVTSGLLIIFGFALTIMRRRSGNVVSS